MKCPICAKPTQVVETRAFGDFVIKRRRVCTEGHRQWTFEVSELIYRRVAHHAISGRAQSGGRLGKVARNDRIVALYEKTQNYAETARRFGLASPTVQRIVKRRHALPPVSNSQG